MLPALPQYVGYAMHRVIMPISVEKDSRQGVLAVGVEHMTWSLVHSVPICERELWRKHRERHKEKGLRKLHANERENEIKNQPSSMLLMDISTIHRPQ